MASPKRSGSPDATPGGASRASQRRDEVVRLLKEAGRPLTAYDLLDQLTGRGSRPAPPLVYRALQRLEAEGVVHRLASLRAYVLCAHPGHRHTAVFAVCDSCGQTQELAGDAVDQGLREAAKRREFTVERWVVEAHGHCALCAEAPPAS